MTTKKRASASPKSAAAPKAIQLDGATLMHLHYHPESKLLRGTVQQDVSIAGTSERVGRDVDFPIADLPPTIQTLAQQLFTQLAAHVGAVPLQVP